MRRIATLHAARPCCACRAAARTETTRPGKGSRVRNALRIVHRTMLTRVHDAQAAYALNAPVRLAWPSDPAAMLRAITGEREWWSVADALRCYPDHLNGAVAVLIRYTVHIKSKDIPADGWCKVLTTAIDALKQNPNEWTYE